MLFTNAQRVKPAGSGRGIDQKQSVPIEND